MASLSISSIADVFPASTSVGAYPAGSWSQAALPPAGAPPVSATASGTVASNGSLAISGLADSTAYFLGASVSGTWRYRRAATAPAAAAGGTETDPVAEADLATHAALTTGAHNLSALLAAKQATLTGTEWQGLVYRGGGFSAKDPDTLDARAHFDAVGDNSTDDTAALRAIAAAVAGGCNKVRFPRGVYRADTSAGAIFDQGANVALSLEGDGAGNVGGDHGTIIKRTAGTAHLLRMTGTGTLGTQRAHGKVHGIHFDGGNLAGTVVELARANEIDFDDVRIGHCIEEGFVAKQLWNSRLSKVFFYDAGSGTTHPATVIGAYAPDGAQGSTQTLQLVACQWEASKGTDLSIKGDATTPTLNTNIQLVAPKFERQVAGATYPVIDIDYAARVNIIGGDISATGGATSQLIVVGANMDPLTGVVTLVGVNFTQPNTDYFVVLGSGGLAVSGCQFVSAPSASYVKIATGVGADMVAMSGNVYTVPSKAVEDRLVAGGQGSYGFQRVTLIPLGLFGSASFDEIGTTGSVKMPDAATSGARFAARIPVEFRSNQQPTFRVTYASTAANGNVRWECRGLSPGTGTDMTVPGTLATATDAAPAAANTTTFVDLVPATGGVNPGNSMSYELKRIGGDALDTNTGDVHIINVAMLGTRRL